MPRRALLSTNGAGALAVLGLLLHGAAGCGDDDPSAACTRHELVVDGSRLSYCEDGTIDIVDQDGQVILERGYAAATLDALSPSAETLSTVGAAGRSLELVFSADALGTADRLVIRTLGDGGDGGGGAQLRWTISAYAEGGFFTFDLAVVNETGEALRVAKASPLRASGREGGGLYLGSDPATHRILENGSHTALDFLAEIRRGDIPRNDVFASAIPGDFQGHSVANWDHAVYDTVTGRGWVAGALTFERSLPVLNLSYLPGASRRSSDGRAGFSYFSAEAAYLPVPKAVPPGEELEAERWYVHPAPADVATELERWAERVALENGFLPWTRRDGGRRVPNGWNSWSGSGSTGGYGTDIDEATILANLDVMAEELRDFGMEWFQIDDGYELAYGDWEWRADRFPSGAAGMSAAIRARGLRPGLWIAPFNPAPDSQLVRDHPDWLAERTPIGSVIVGGDDEILDLTHPEVQTWLRALFRRFRHEWGYEWLKLDFGYLALLGQGYFDPTRTREEAWRAALSLVREEIGQDAFFALVGTIGMNFGIIDSGRTTLDSQPVWDWEPGLGPYDRMEQQGLKPVMRTSGRRWYLQDRVWVNHPDLIFFRSHPDPTWPRLTLSESAAFCTFVGLGGGIVKLGDRLVDLQPDHLNVIRTILPSYGRAARPIDLFEREYPERWHLPVEPLDGYDERYDLLGLYHWGFNVDIGSTPFVEIADDAAPRRHVVDLAMLGIEGERHAYEFWTQRYLGRVSGTLSLEVPAHAARVVALREPLDRPQLLGWNRQVTMGGVLLEEVRWDDSTRTLSVRMPVAAGTDYAPFTHELAFFLPTGFGLVEGTLTGAAVEDVEWVDEGEVLRLRFRPTEPGPLAIAISF